MAESSREEIAKLEALYAGNPGGRVFVHLAEAYRKAGEHERARRILDEGLGRHVDSASGHVVLGRVLADMQIMGEAEIAFRRVLALDSGNLVALRWLGDLARQAGRNAEAAAHYRELLVRNPSNEEVRDLVEIVEREAVSPAPHARDDDEPYGRVATEDVSHWSTGTREDLAVSGPVSEVEEPAVSPPADLDSPSDRDVTPWSAAPGETGDTEDPDVKFELVEIEAVANIEAVTNEDATPYEAGVRSSDEPARDDEADFVASFDDDEASLLELDELRRDDEAEPIEIHLLDPSYESPDDEADEFVGELDLSDLEAAASVEDEEEYADDSFIADLETVVPEEDEGEYADDSFIADLSSAGKEEPPEDELPAVVDLMTDRSALTLLPDEGETGAGDDTRTADDEVAGYTVFAEADEPDDEADFAFDGGTGDVEFGFGSALAGDSGQDADDGAAAPAEYVFTDASDDPPEPAAETIGEPAAHVPEEPAAEVMEEPAAEAGDEPAADGPEDATDEPGSAALTELSGAAQPATEAGPAEVRRDADIGLVTETMAVLYRSQGFHERAAEVYRALLRARPGDERLAARLREAEAATAPAAASVGEDAGEDAAEVWLRGVATAWTAPRGPADDATPYAWTADADEAETGEPIGSYLKDLVTWKAGTRRWMEQQQEPEAAQTGDEVELPDWLNDAAGSEPWTPDMEPAGIEPVAAADAGWSPAEPVLEPDPWLVPDEPTDVAAAPESQQAAEAGRSEHVASAASPADALSAPLAEPPSTQDKPDASGAGWKPLDQDRDAPDEGASVEPLPPLPEPSGLEEDSAEDEDLEMFRSWLQSLKK